MQQYHYPGNELALFEGALKWKNYFKQKIKPFIKGDVLEVGAGIGGTTKVLNDGSINSWTLVEPDAAMYQRLMQIKKEFPANISILQDWPTEKITAFDTILYIDVLEHIEDDVMELHKASGWLKPGGHLVVLSPAHQFLFSAFDKELGHFRRYNKKGIKRITPAGMELVSLYYLDSLGFFASLMNRLLLKQSYPTKKQVELWDRNFIPISKIVDPLLLRSLGKTILAVWQKK